MLNIQFQHVLTCGSTSITAALDWRLILQLDHTDRNGALDARRPTSAKQREQCQTLQPRRPTW